MLFGGDPTIGSKRKHITTRMDPKRLDQKPHGTMTLVSITSRKRSDVDTLVPIQQARYLHNDDR